MFNAYDKLVAEQRYDLTECYVRNFDFVIYWEKLKIEIVPFETTKSKGPYENGHTSVSLRYNAGMIDNAKRDCKKSSYYLQNAMNALKMHDIGISHMFFPNQFEFQISSYFSALMVLRN